MFSLVNLFWLISIGVIALYWWQSGLYKGRARQLATTHCRKLELQLLDQSMVITGFWPARNNRGNWVFRRRYQFEFTSTGDQRYQGKLVLLGMHLGSIDLETYRLPQTDPEIG